VENSLMVNFALVVLLLGSGVLGIRLGSRLGSQRGDFSWKTCLWMTALNLSCYLLACWGGDSLAHLATGSHPCACCNLRGVWTSSMVRYLGLLLSFPLTFLVFRLNWKQITFPWLIFWLVFFLNSELWNRLHSLPYPGK